MTGENALLEEGMGVGGRVVGVRRTLVDVGKTRVGVLERGLVANESVPLSAEELCMFTERKNPQKQS